MSEHQASRAALTSWADATKVVVLASAVGGAVATLTHVALTAGASGGRKGAGGIAPWPTLELFRSGWSSSAAAETVPAQSGAQEKLRSRLEGILARSKSRVDDGIGTTLVHAGQEADAQTGAVVPPISLATTFAQATPGTLRGEDMPTSFGKGWEYSRTGNPTRGSFERALAAAEEGSHCCAFASGSAATSAVLHLCESGDHVVVVDDVYGGTQRYFRRIAKPVYNIDFTFVDFNDPARLRSAVDTPRTKLLWLETPTNPTLKVSSIAAAAAEARRVGALLAVDNTFASPFFQTPLRHGADLVVHSVTKYIGGHSDVVMGAVVTDREDLQERLRFVQNGLGAVPSPFDCYLALRGLKTLHVRMAQAQANAADLAAWLENHPQVVKVLYPGLKSHKQYELAQTQMYGAGAMITFYVRGGIAEAAGFLAALELFTLAESLGAVESLAEAPSVMTHASVPPEQRKLLGIDDNLVRLSVGIEAVEDLRADLAHALATMSP